MLHAQDIPLSHRQSDLPSICRRIQNLALSGQVEARDALIATALGLGRDRSEPWPELTGAILSGQTLELMTLLRPVDFAHANYKGHDWVSILKTSSPAILLAAAGLGLSFKGALLPVLERAFDDEMWLPLLEDESFQIASTANFSDVIHAFGMAGHEEAPLLARFLTSLTASCPDHARLLLRKALCAQHTLLAQVFLIAGSDLPSDIQTWFLPKASRELVERVSSAHGRFALLAELGTIQDVLAAPD
jgi:hypothetical protein